MKTNNSLLEPGLLRRGTSETSEGKACNPGGEAATPCSASERDAKESELGRQRVRET